MVKHVEFDSLPDGAIFRWEGASWYYTYDVTVTYTEHRFKQSFIHRLLYGKMPEVMRMPERHYGGLKWKPVEELVPPAYSLVIGTIVDIYQIGEFEESLADVMETYQGIVDSCPVDNVVVFGYGLDFSGDEIRPGVISAGFGESDVFLRVGFAGYD